MTDSNTPMRYHFPPNRLAALVNARGGKTRDQAIAEARACMEEARELGLEGMKEAIATITDCVGAARSSALSPAQLETILEAADRIVALAGTLSYAPLTAVARSLCELTNIFIDASGPAPVAPVEVHIAAAQTLFASRAALGESAEVTAVLNELDRVVKHFRTARG
jgi:hypothetical protein